MDENINKNNDKSSSAKLIAGAIIIAGVLVAGAILLKGQNSPTVNKDGFDLGKVELQKTTTEEHIRGNPNAKIVIMEYSDTECPYCKVFHATMKQVLEKYGNDVAWIYKQYPIDQLHPKARKEAEATECAWDQGGNEMFWKYLDRIFELTESNNKLDPAQLPKIAQELGLDVTAFNSCLETGKFAEKVEADIQSGISFAQQLLPAREGLPTPASIIIKKGKVVDFIEGAYPFAQVSAKIDAALK
ncbi:MAG: thioredoxin domain-containing protein [Candidatus Paceibacterota bacterium]|jgi:protein-disulfide isomerase